MADNANSKNEEWKLVLNDDYDMEEYPSGLRAGDRLRLREDLPIKTHDGSICGTVKRTDGTWTVLIGLSQDPNLLWLREPSGSVHTWEDDIVFETFEKVEDE